MNIKRNLKEEKTFKSIMVQNLKEGNEFKLHGQRKWRNVRKIIHLLPEPHKGCTLIIYDDCKQMVLPPEVDVLINERISSIA